MTWHDVDVYKSIHAVRWVIPSCFCARKRQPTFAVFPSLPPELRVFSSDMSWQISFWWRLLSEADGCSGLLLWTLVCAVVYLFSSC